MPTMENDRESAKEKPYKLVVNHIKEEIIKGRILPGERLPGERELAEQLGISRNSVLWEPIWKWTEKYSLA